jgi:hypothetical protein
MHFCNSGGLLKTSLFPPCGPSILNSQGYTGYWQFQQPYPAFIQLLTNTFLYSFSSTPCSTSLQHFILLFVNSLSYYLRHLILLLIETLSCFSPTTYPAFLQHLILLLIITLSSFSPTPYNASHQNLILFLSSTLSCFSPTPYPASHQNLPCFSSTPYPASHQHLNILSCFSRSYSSLGVSSRAFYLGL